uniref:Ubiquitin carboxyl-terminal hydrolase n=1 Tax=Oreochromis niloticus TaxID=8128 RepID=A0A669BHZ2_ORENI
KWQNGYIFGEFSPDEINQFFVTPRCYVELPPFNDKVQCVTQSSGEDYQHIEFGVDEVMDSKAVGGNDPLYKVSSTLNPQAPEFILGCQPAQKAQQTASPAADVPDGAHFNSLDGPDSEASALDNHQPCPDMDGLPGNLGQRERKKKKKRPPGYYNYLEPSTGSNSSSTSTADGTPVTALVNGHALSGPHHSTEDVDSKALSGAELSTPGPASTATPTAAVAAAKCAPTSTAWYSKTLVLFIQPLMLLPFEAGVDEETIVLIYLYDTYFFLCHSCAKLPNVKLIHKPVSLQPRGLINKGNWCYINATLQALIACPPMYHLMKSIPLHNETQRPCTSTPMIDNFVRLVNEFNNMPVPSKAKQQAVGDKVTKDIRPGAPFEPTYIYKLLTLIKSSLSEKGRQEDAEEYLGFTLNGLHEEMLALKKLISPQEEKAPTPNGPESEPGVEEDGADKEEEGSEDEWEQVGPRNKTSITRQADFVRTPITDIFGGHIRSVVYQQNSKESATLQPFFTLQLDIQSDKIRTVQEALETLVARESVQGYTSKTKQEIEISRRVTLEELPPVLVLHLKRFVFEKSGGCQKLTKNIDYPVDLEISKDLLSSGVRSKVVKGQRTYRLFAVVYHHGNSATGGHYTTDVFHIGLNGWLRIDDQTVKVINQYQVVKQTAERTAYLLYYRRVDLL